MDLFSADQADPRMAVKTQITADLRVRLLSDTSDIPELPAKLAQVLAVGIFA
jgi:hypothetical protein